MPGTDPTEWRGSLPDCWAKRHDPGTKQHKNAQDMLSVNFTQLQIKLFGQRLESTQETLSVVYVHFDSDHSAAKCFRLQVTRFSYHQLILQPVQPLAMKSAGWVGICQGMTKKNHETSFCHICGLDLAWHKFASSAIITSKHNCACSSWHIAFVFVFTSQVQGLWTRHIAPWRTRNQMYMMAKNTKRSREMWKKQKTMEKQLVENMLHA